MLTITLDDYIMKQLMKFINSIHNKNARRSKNEDAEAEAHVMLAWLKEGKYWVNLGGKEEISTRERLLQLLLKVEDAELRAEIEKSYYSFHACLQLIKFLGFLDWNGNLRHFFPYAVCFSSFLVLRH